MHTQTGTKADKKAARRRNRNKRRRKLRQQRKLQASGVPNIQTPRRKQAKPKAKKTTEEISKAWETLCLETYQRLTTWQSEAELNFWKARAEWLQNENEGLKEQLNEYAKKNSNETDSNGKPAINDEESDVAYLEFIAVTRKHREELRQKREKQNEMKSVD